MPNFKDSLTRAQIEDIAAYLANQKGPAAPAPPPPPGLTSPPAVPHDLEDRLDCLACHETGVGRAPRVPIDHTGRTNGMCLTCHKSSDLND